MTMSRFAICPSRAGACRAGIVLAGFVGLSTAIDAASISWDRAANVREAAHRLVGIHSARGAPGAYKFISDCYATHSLASAYGRALEACIAQDYMFTQTLVLIYERLPAEKRQKMGTVEPAQLAAGMSNRIGAALAQYKMTEADGEVLRKLVETEGFPVFFKERFPGKAQ